MTASLLARWIHVVAAITWIGGMIFLVLVLAPVARHLDPAARARLVREVGRRFRTVGWIAVGILVASGLANLWLVPGLLALPRFQAKLALVGVAVGLALLHDFVVGPRAGRPGAAPTARAHASWMARVNLLVALVIVLLGLGLLR